MNQVLCLPTTGLGSASTRTTHQPTQQTSHDQPSTNQGPALIDEEEQVGDDWLIDDLQPITRKRNAVNNAFVNGSTRSGGTRNTSASAVGNTQQRPNRRQQSESDDVSEGESMENEVLTHSARATYTDSDVDIAEFPSSGVSSLEFSGQSHAVASTSTSRPSVLPQNNRMSTKPKQRQPRITHFRAIENTALSISSTMRSGNRADVPQSGRSQPLIDRSHESQAVPTSCAAAPSVSMRLRVRIKDKVILVPVLHRWVIIRGIQHLIVYTTTIYTVFILIKSWQ